MTFLSTLKKSATVAGDVLTTKGDILTRTASALARLGVGSNNQMIVADSGESLGIAWKTATASLISDFDTEVANNSAVTANTAKTTNATHSGEVTGSGALTIANNIVDEANLKVSNAPTNGYMLTAQSGNTGGLTWAEAGGGATVSTKSVALSSDFSTTSSSYVDITGLTVTLATISGGEYIASMPLTVKNDHRWYGMYALIEEDGTDDGDTAMFCGNDGTNIATGLTMTLSLSGTPSGQALQGKGKASGSTAYFYGTTDKKCRIDVLEVG